MTKKTGVIGFNDFLNEENKKKKEYDKEHKRIICVGAGASGKDYARKLFEKRSFTYGISYTSRPPRKGEKDGVDYHFLSPEEFKKLIEEDFFYEHVIFNEWYYGTSNDQFYKDDIFLMTPHGISKIKAEDRKHSFIIYFDIPEDIRRERIAKRSDADNVERRIASDKKDFKGFKDFDIVIKNEEF